MADEGQNYSMFNSRMLVDVVGDVTDEALKASRIKDIIGVLAGRVFNWGQRKSLFPLHLGIKCCALEMAAAGASRFDAERFGVFFRSVAFTPHRHPQTERSGVVPGVWG